jgi:hypothetical protein
MMNALSEDEIQPSDGTGSDADMMSFPYIISMFIAWNISRFLIEGGIDELPRYDNPKNDRHCQTLHDPNDHPLLVPKLLYDHENSISSKQWYLIFGDIDKDFAMFFLKMVFFQGNHRYW